MICNYCEFFNEGNCYRHGYLKMVEPETKKCEKFVKDSWKERIENTTCVLDVVQDD